MRTASVIALLVVLAVLAPTQAFIFHLPTVYLGGVTHARRLHGEEDEHQQASNLLTVSEGQMFSLAGAPFGADESYIRISGTAALQPGPDHEISTVLNIVFFSEFNQQALGWSKRQATGSTLSALADTEDAADDLKHRTLCCSTEMFSAGICSHPGHVIVNGINANLTASLPAATGWAIEEGATPPFLQAMVMTAAPLDFNARHVVAQSGEQSVALVMCDKSFALAERTALDLVVEFRNPYGYLRAVKWGFLPGYGTLAALYALMLVVYLISMGCHHDKLIPLQLMVACVIAMGLIETATWFFAYSSKNVTGIPVCDADGSCPPLTTDIMVAAILQVAKNSVGRVLLLVVCLGFGVVRPRLSRKNTILVSTLGVAYFGFSTLLAVDEATSAYVSRSVWSLPVVVCDLIILVWIYLALDATRTNLKRDNQTAKFMMYSRLANTLAVFVGVWVILAMIATGIAFGLIPLMWQYAWTLHSLWDVLLFFLLVCIAVIWAPGERTQRYALYSQPRLSDDGDAGDVEMAGVGRAGDDEDDIFTDDEDLTGDDDGAGAGAGSDYSGGSGGDDDSGGGTAHDAAAEPEEVTVEVMGAEAGDVADAAAAAAATPADGSGGDDGSTGAFAIDSGSDAELPRPAATDAELFGDDGSDDEPLASTRSGSPAEAAEDEDDGLGLLPPPRA